MATPVAAAPRLLFVAVLCAGALAGGAASAAAASAPLIESSWVTDVTATSASLRAEINPNGAATSYHFDYITQAAYRANLDAVPPREGFAGATRAPLSGSAGAGSGSAAVLLTQHIGGLAPTTLYRFRALAANSGGTTTGPERTLGTEEATNAFALLDGRGWEMVSPIDKNGGAVQPPESIIGGGAFQAAADGQSLTYSSADSFGAAQGAPAGSQYIARRSGAGWSSQNITEPTPSGGYGDHPDGVPYQLFSTDLARGLLLNPRFCAEGEECPRSYSVRESSSGALTPSTEAPGLRFEGAGPDLRHVILSACAALTPEATEVPSGGGGCEPAETNLYEWSGGALSLINEPASHHARLAAGAGAISADGRRVYFTAGEHSPIYLREAGQPTKFIEETVGGVGSFQAASADGSLAFFTAAGTLYRYDALTDSASEPLAAEVQGVLGASGDGSRVYYLTPAGLFLWQAPGATTEIAPGPPAAFAGDYPPTTGTARISADGTHLLFLSAAELTDYENNGVTEVYLYDATATGALTCVSCNPTGERPQGASWISGAIADGSGAEATRVYKPRALSADGRRVFFESSDRLAIQDTNLAPDVYEWEASGEGTCAREGGCVGLVSSGRSSAASTFIDASGDGSDAFFLTDSSLYPLDPGSFDLYDAREGGGFAPPPNVIPCKGDACQALPSAPEDPTPGTLVPNSGNPPLRIAKPKKGQKRRHRNHKHHGRAKKHAGHGGRR